MAKLRGRFGGSISAILIATLIVLSFSLIALAWYAKNLGERSLALQVITADLGGEVIIESIAPKWFPVSVRESRFFSRATELHLESFPTLSAALDGMLCSDQSEETGFIDVRLDRPVTDACVTQRIANTPTLRAIFLDSYPIGDEALAELGSLRKVEILTIAKTMCTNEGLRHLKDWPRLTHLRCSSLPLDDRAVAHLQRLRTLEYLDISHTQISEGGILALAALPQLRHLRIIGLNVSPESVEQLGKQLPHLKVERKNIFGHQDNWDWEANPVKRGIEIHPPIQRRVPRVRQLL